MHQQGIVRRRSSGARRDPDVRGRCRGRAGPLIPDRQTRRRTTSRQPVHGGHRKALHHQIRELLTPGIHHQRHDLRRSLLRTPAVARRDGDVICAGRRRDAEERPRATVHRHPGRHPGSGPRIRLRAASRRHRLVRRVACANGRRRRIEGRRGDRQGADDRGDRKAQRGRVLPIRVDDLDRPGPGIAPVVEGVAQLVVRDKRRHPPGVRATARIAIRQRRPVHEVRPGDRHRLITVGRRIRTRTHTAHRRRELGAVLDNRRHSYVAH